MIVEDVVRRPALLVRGGSFDATESTLWQEVLEGARPLLEAALPSVGRLELADGRSAGGTAWMVAPGIAVTAGHVARGLPRGCATTGCRVDFGRELGGGASTVCVVERIVCGPWQADVAFLELAEPSTAGSVAAPPPLLLGDASAAAVAVALVGYPVAPRDEACEPAEVRRLLDGMDGVKRLQPGRIVKLEPPRFDHDASTSGDNSGSPAVELSTGRVVGMHTDGSCTARANWGVCAGTIRSLVPTVASR